MSEEQIKELIKNTKGKFFSVQFMKRTDGTFRWMNCRTGVRKGLKGGGRNYDPVKKNLVSVWDVQKQAYRMIAVEGILKIRFRAKTYLPDGVEEYAKG